MRTLLPLLTLSLSLSLAATPAFAGDNGHKAHKERARSHDDAGAKNDRGRHNGHSAQARADRARAEAARAEAARADRARADRAHAEAARRDRARHDAHARAAHTASARRAEAARREAARRRAAQHHAAHGRPVAPPPRRATVAAAPQRRAKAPNVFADRAGQVSIGLNGGSLISGYESGTSFGDVGMGLTARYRVTPGFGVETSLSQHRGSEGDRVTTPLSLGVQGFGFPTGRVNPYAAAGVTFTGRNFDDVFCDGEEFDTFSANDTLFGPYGGLGLELAVAPNATINLEGRLSSYMNLPEEDPTVPVSFGAKAGVNFYF